jgi:hypothetical protein
MTIEHLRLDSSNVMRKIRAPDMLLAIRTSECTAGELR